MHLYLAGPMRGYEKFNFPEFERATSYLRSLGYEVTSPAEMDLDMGLDPNIANTDEEANFDVEDALRRDFEVILKADGIALLDGWQNSTGARAERFVAEKTGKLVMNCSRHGGSYRLYPSTDAHWDGDPRVPQPDDDDEPVPALAAAGARRREQWAEQERLARVGAMGVTSNGAGAAESAMGRYMREQPGSFVAAAQQLATISGMPTKEELRGGGVTIEGDEPDTTNPKDLLGIKKPQLHLVPESFVIRVAQAMTDGARKYGPYNWREKQVRATVYISAARRHIGQWFDGEECAKDSGVPHLAHAAACLAILLDAIETGNLVDDRPPAGAASRLIEELTT